MTNTSASPDLRFQCRHVFTDGHRCGSICLKKELFCYFHHTSRKPVENLRERRAFQSAAEAANHSFDLPNPEDRSAIQSGIGLILRSLAANRIDTKRAGLLLYGLQIASLNLPKAQPEETVEEITLDETHGILAPEAAYTDSSFHDPANRGRSFAQILLEDWQDSQKPAQPQVTEEVAVEVAVDVAVEEQAEEANPIPTLQAVASNSQLKTIKLSTHKSKFFSISSQLASSQLIDHKHPHSRQAPPASPHPHPSVLYCPYPSTHARRQLVGGVRVSANEGTKWQTAGHRSIPATGDVTCTGAIRPGASSPQDVDS